MQISLIPERIGSNWMLLFGRKPGSNDGRVKEAEIIEYVTGLPGVVTVTASEENAAPAAAWGGHILLLRSRREYRRESATPVRHLGDP
jgi:hypothetical protein